MSATTSISRPLEPSDQLQRGRIWFDDGNLVLVAGNTMFRVHASLLSRCSTVFKDMFSVPQPSNSSPEAMVEGCPVVHLHDSPEDVECLLNAIYEYPYSSDAASPITPMKLSMVSAFLRLGNKYDIPHLRDHAVSRLRNEYPSAYDPESPYNLRGYLEFYKGRAFDVSCLAYEEGVFSLLPITLHLITSSFTTKEILDGFTLPDGTKVALPQSLVYACILGKEKLHKVMCTESYKFLTQPTPPHCAQNSTCLGSIRYLAKEIWQPFPDLRYALCYTWHMIRASLASRDVKFCDNCSRKLNALHQEGRKMVWEALPGIFGFQSWEEVKRMDRVLVFRHRSRTLFRPSDTVSMLNCKKKIERDQGLDVTMQSLVHTAEELKNDKALALYGIKEGDFLVLCLVDPEWEALANTNDKPELRFDGNEGLDEGDVANAGDSLL